MNMYVFMGGYFTPSWTSGDYLGPKTLFPRRIVSNRH